MQDPVRLLWAGCDHGQGRSTCRRSSFPATCDRPIPKAVVNAVHERTEYVVSECLNSYCNELDFVVIDFNQIMHEYKVALALQARPNSTGAVF